MDERRAVREKLVAKLPRGPALQGLDFGFPLSPNGVAYALCIYDAGGVVVGAIDVERAGAECGSNPCWKPLGKGEQKSDGYLHKDKAGDEDGVRVLQLKAGSSGRSRISCSASQQGKNGQTTLPTGIAAALADATEVSYTPRTRAASQPCSPTSSGRRPASSRRDVLAEQNLAAAGRIRPGTAARMGEMDGAELLVVGSVTGYEDDVRQKDWWAGVPVAGVAAGERRTSRIAMDLRLVDARTGRVLAATSVEGTADQRSFFGGAIVGGGAGSRVKGPMEMAARKALAAAVDWIVSQTPPQYYHN